MREDIRKNIGEELYAREIFVERDNVAKTTHIFSLFAFIRPRKQRPLEQTNKHWHIRCEPIGT